MNRPSQILLALLVGALAWPISAWADVDDYAITWNADRFLIARGDFHGRHHEFVFGVAGWLVTGEYPNGPSFKETWRLEGPYPTFKGNPIKVEFGKAGEEEKWLSGAVDYAAEPGLAMNLAVSTMTADRVYFDLKPSVTFDNGRAMNVGLVNSCESGDYHCVFMSGPYAFRGYRNLSSASDNISISHNRGTLIPLEWQVTGKVCNQKRCP